MKKGGTFALLCLTLAFVGFAIGMLIGRNLEKEPVTIGISTKPESTEEQQHLQSSKQKQCPRSTSTLHLQKFWIHFPESVLYWHSES